MCAPVHPHVECLTETLESRMTQTLDFVVVFQHLPTYNEISWGRDLTLNIQFVYISYIPIHIA